MLDDGPMRLLAVADEAGVNSEYEEKAGIIWCPPRCGSCGGGGGPWMFREAVVAGAPGWDDRAPDAEPLLDGLWTSLGRPGLVPESIA